MALNFLVKKKEAIDPALFQAVAATVAYGAKQVLSCSDPATCSVHIKCGGLSEQNCYHELPLQFSILLHSFASRLYIHHLANIAVCWFI
jgi:hypothetical protein